MINSLIALGPLILVIIIFLIMVPVLYMTTRRKAWRVKEKVEELTLAAPRSNLLTVQAKIKRILVDLSPERLTLRSAADHIDRADAFWKLGDLQMELMQFVDSESCYRAAIDAYNDALKLEPNNRIAISNKFNTVECLNQLARRRF
jgi:tetratricopeptide (TPR) repeat protein